MSDPTCEQCGAVLPPGRRKFCTRICSRRAHNATEGAIAKKRERKRRELERVKSDPALAAHRRKVNQRWVDSRLGPSWLRDAYCDACGCPIRGNRKWCGHHVPTAAEIRARYRPTQRAAHSRYRMRRRSAVVEMFTHEEIFERDRWLCQLCGLPTDRTVDGRSSSAPSLDHIVPISLGGVHSRANTQCAHKGCNSAKNNRYAGYQQMSLLEAS